MKTINLTTDIRTAAELFKENSNDSYINLFVQKLLRVLDKKDYNQAMHESIKAYRELGIEIPDVLTEVYLEKSVTEKKNIIYQFIAALKTN
ncbi:hypothetical protein LJC10_00375 [Selenomonadales bacterium OttesenSCG-928-I06]|nr:hypothetical protein [Selenomonadales bacterium OttesenSCG-928-I06]